jgi:hypothetical protein
MCPWDPVAHCATGCAEDGYEVIGGRADAAAAQLCRPDVPVARPVLPSDPFTADICRSEGVACVDGIVSICDAGGQAARPLAVCLYGCPAHVGIDNAGDHGPPKNPAGVISILCRRDHAERR